MKSGNYEFRQLNQGNNRLTLYRNYDQLKWLSPASHLVRKSVSLATHASALYMGLAMFDTLITVKTNAVSAKLIFLLLAPLPLLNQF